MQGYHEEEKRKMDELAVWLQEHEAQMIEDIGELVGIESVADENGFVAECGFPVCCGGKGICRVELETEAVLG